MAKIKPKLYLKLLKFSLFSLTQLLRRQLKFILLLETKQKGQQTILSRGKQDLLILLFALLCEYLPIVITEAP